MCLKGRRRKPEREVSRGRSSRNVGKGPNEKERYTTMSMERALHQMPASAGRATVRDGEAVSKVVSDEACSTRHEMESAGQALLEQALARENMQRAWKRVKANKGAAGVDGMDIAQTGRYLTNAWQTSEIN